MQVTKKNLSPTKFQLRLIADAVQLRDAKQASLQHFAKDIKLPGFRAGKAPLGVVEKNVDQTHLQSDFAERAINSMYVAALDQEKLRPVTQPEIKIVKFVPYDTLEVEAEVEAVGEIKLPDYKKMRLPKEKISVTAKEIDEVIATLRTREAEKKEVTHAAKDGNEAVIDFTGTDAKTKEPISGADGKDYPLLLGSDTFIPGFEANVIGLKPGEEKTFTLTFPKDYGVSALQNRKVTFAVTVKKVQELAEPKFDDAFAAKVGPFKTVAELKDDIKKELQARKESEADQKYADDLLTKIAEKAKVDIPDALIEEQLDRLQQDQRQNLVYRGQTWQEYLEAEKLTEETWRKKQRPAAELRVKAGLVLAEAAEAEKITVTPAELNAYMTQLAARYPDNSMQAELAKPESRRTIMSRMLSEKTVAKLVGYASA